METTKKNNGYLQWGLFGGRFMGLFGRVLGQTKLVGVGGGLCRTVMIVH